MKAVVIAFVLIGATAFVSADLSDEQKQKLVEHHKICVSSSGVDAETVTKARQGNISNDDKLKQFALCMSKRVGFQNDAGEIQKEVIRQKLAGAINDEAAAEKLIAKCLTRKDSPEDTAIETFKCYYENTPTHIAIF